MGDMVKTMSNTTFFWRSGARGVNKAKNTILRPSLAARIRHTLDEYPHPGAPLWTYNVSPAPTPIFVHGNHCGDSDYENLKLHPTASKWPCANLAVDAAVKTFASALPFWWCRIGMKRFVLAKSVMSRPEASLLGPGSRPGISQWQSTSSRDDLHCGRVPMDRMLKVPAL